MILSAVSIVFGLVSLFIPIPVLFPVCGLALSANSFIKEGKKSDEDQDKSVKVLSIIGMVVCGLSTLLFFLTRDLAL